jgi:hypothetical protein
MDVFTACCRGLYLPLEPALNRKDLIKELAKWLAARGTCDVLQICASPLSEH